MKIESSDRLSFVEEYYFSRKLREIRTRKAAGEEIFNLGIGSPDLPPHPEVIQTLARVAAEPEAHHYQSYAGLPELREAYSHYYFSQYQVDLNPKDEILSLIGSKEGIMHLSMAVLNSEDQVLVPNPGYGSYASCARLAGAEPVYYRLEEKNGWCIDLDALKTMDTSKVKILWVNYPHMPTGTVPSFKHLEDLVSFAQERNILICNDNPYSTILTETPLSILQVDGAKGTACELNSLSKSHNMAGWRVGMLGGSAKLIQTVLKFKSNMDSGKFKAIQMAAVTALHLDNTWYESLNDTYRSRQEIGIKMLRMLGCKVNKPDAGMFLWARIPSGYKDGISYSEYLLDTFGIFIPPGSIFGDVGQNYIRMSLCTSGQVISNITSKIEERLRAHAR